MESPVRAEAVQEPRSKGALCYYLEFIEVVAVFSILHHSTKHQ